MTISILLVDDEQDMLEFSQRALRDEEYKILTCSSAPEALQVLDRTAVDVIISDERMPGMYGTEFLRRARLKHPDTIRIILTGYAQISGALDAVNSGDVYRFLTKPISPIELASTIRHAIQVRTVLGKSRFPAKTENSQIKKPPMPPTVNRHGSEHAFLAENPHSFFVIEEEASGGDLEYKTIATDMKDLPQFTASRGELVPICKRSGANTYSFIAIGRSSNNDIVLARSGVSKCHVVLEKTPGGYVLKDAGSKNGTWVNGTRLKAHEPVTLKSGDSVSISARVSAKFLDPKAAYHWLEKQ